MVAGSPVVRDGTGPTAWCGLPGVWSVRAPLFLGPGGDGLRRRDGAIVGRRGHLAPDVRMQGGGARQPGHLSCGNATGVYGLTRLSPATSWAPEHSGRGGGRSIRPVAHAKDQPSSKSAQGCFRPSA